MVDISKCVKGCDRQDKCYRWTAKGSDYQSYSNFKPDEKGECDSFMSNKNLRTRRY